MFKYVQCHVSKELIAVLFEAYHVLCLLLLCRQLLQRVLQRLGLARVELALLLQGPRALFVLLHPARGRGGAQCSLANGPFQWKSSPS